MGIIYTPCTVFFCRNKQQRAPNFSFYFCFWGDSTLTNESLGLCTGRFAKGSGVWAVEIFRWSWVSTDSQETNSKKRGSHTGSSQHFILPLCCGRSGAFYIFLQYTRTFRHQVGRSQYTRIQISLVV